MRPGRVALPCVPIHKPLGSRLEEFPQHCRSFVDRRCPLYKGRGISWHFNFACEISRFKLTKFPTQKFWVLREFLAHYQCIQ